MIQSSPGVKIASAPSEAVAEVLRRVVLADVLDDEILGASPGDRSFPLRVFFGALGDALGDETGFTLSCALNLFFRAEMDEEWKMRVGVEASRLYYLFASEGKLDAPTTKQVSPLLAKLLSTQLERVRIEAIDHAAVFDSALHERVAGSNTANATIARPATMLCRVAANGAVRIKAGVIT